MADDRAPFRSILTTLPFTSFRPPCRQYSPHIRKMRVHAPICLTRFDSIFPQRGAKGMDVCTCFHGQRNDENHELSAIGQRSMLQPPCFTAPPRVINRGWPA